MEPIDISNATHIFMPPDGLEGAVGPLKVVIRRVDDLDSDCVISLWKPSDEDRRVISAGGNIALFVQGHQQPVVALTVTTDDSV